MRQYPGTLNRTWLALLGILVLLSGLYVVLAWTGVVPGPAQNSPVVSAEVGSVLDQVWAAVAIAVLGVIVGVLALFWLLAQIPKTNRARSLRLQDDAARGLTMCDPEVITDVVQEDLVALAGVRSADAVLRGTAKNPELTVRVGVDDRAEIQSLLRQIKADVVGPLATAMDAPLTRLAVRVDIERGKRNTDKVTL